MRRDMLEDWLIMEKGYVGRLVERAEEICWSIG